MAKKRRKKREDKEESSKAMWALLGIGIMAISSIAYALLSNPFSSPAPVEEQPEIEAGVPQIEQTPPVSTPGDSDGDGIPDSVERELGLNPFQPETPETLKLAEENLYRKYINGEISLSEYSAKEEILLKAKEGLK